METCNAGEVTRLSISSDIINPMHKIKLIVFIVLFSLTACSGYLPNVQSPFSSPTPIPPTVTPAPPTATPKPMAIAINGEGITVDEFNQELARYKAIMLISGISIPDGQALKTVQDDLINTVLLSQGAAKDGFTLDDAGVQKRIDDLVSKLGSPDKLSAWETKNNYTDESFRVSLKRSAAAARMRDKIISGVGTTAEQVHIKQILLYNPDAANNYYGQLQAGANFDDLAAEIDPIALGDIGWFPKGYLPEKNVEDAAFSLQIGAYSTVIQGEVGYHILMLIDKKPDVPLSPDALLVLQSNAVNYWLNQQKQQNTIIVTP